MFSFESNVLRLKNHNKIEDFLTCSYILENKRILIFQPLEYVKMIYFINGKRNNFTITLIYLTFISQTAEWLEAVTIRSILEAVSQSKCFVNNNESPCIAKWDIPLPPENEHFKRINIVNLKLWNFKYS